jgi:glycosyltransferase involved in cell wall biosynthesis
LENLLCAARALYNEGRVSSAKELSAAAYRESSSEFHMRIKEAAEGGDTTLIWLGMQQFSNVMPKAESADIICDIWNIFLKTAKDSDALIDPLFVQIRLIQVDVCYTPAEIQHDGPDLAYVLALSLPQDTTGYAHRSHELIRALNAVGVTTQCFTRPGFPWDRGVQEVLGENVVDGIRYFRTGDYSFNQPITINDFLNCEEVLFQSFLESRPRFVMAASNYATAIPALFAAKRLGLTFIYEVRGFWDLSRATRDMDYRDSFQFIQEAALEGCVAEASDIVFTLNSSMRDELASRGVSKEKVGILSNAADLSRFSVLPRNENLKALLGIPPQTPVIGYIGSFTIYEGLDDLILACGELARSGIDFALVIAGWDPRGENHIGPSLIDLAKTSGVYDRLIMLGHLAKDEVPALYSVIDIAPVPRKDFPVTRLVSPLKPIEAMAMGKAVVVSDLPPLLEIIGGADCGCAFPAGDPVALSSVLAELCVDTEHRARMGHAARERVEAVYSWRECALAFWQSVLNRSGFTGSSS